MSSSGDPRPRAGVPRRSARAALRRGGSRFRDLDQLHRRNDCRAARTSDRSWRQAGAEGSTPRAGTDSTRGDDCPWSQPLDKAAFLAGLALCVSGLSAAAADIARGRERQRYSGDPFKSAIPLHEVPEQKPQVCAAMLPGLHLRRTPAPRQFQNIKPSNGNRTIEDREPVLFDDDRC